MEVAYVFGRLGNVGTAATSGWSVEDEFAWTVGTESLLTLQLPPHDGPCALSFDVRPAVFPPAIRTQKLTFRLDNTDLASFEFGDRRVIEVLLPAGLVPEGGPIQLRLHHPAPARPSDHQQTDDARLLGFCFHSVRIRPDRSGTEEERTDRMTAIFVGDFVTMRIVEILRKLPSLKGCYDFAVINVHDPLDGALAGPVSTRLTAANFCWFEVNHLSAAMRTAVGSRLAKNCTVRSFRVPSCGALWPTLGPDHRSVPEPAFYRPYRYPYGDTLAARFAMLSLPDDILMSMYESAYSQEPFDLDALLAADRQRWQREDGGSDITLGDFIATNFRAERLFAAPDRPAPALLREILRQILTDDSFGAGTMTEALVKEADALLAGHFGWHQELPIHSRVASYFELKWWSPDTRYRWHNNRMSYSDYILSYIRWARWRP